MREVVRPSAISKPIRMIAFIPGLQKAPRQKEPGEARENRYESEEKAGASVCNANSEDAE